jgi:hypothetical protein
MDPNSSNKGGGGSSKGGGYRGKKPYWQTKKKGEPEAANASTAANGASSTTTTPGVNNISSAHDKKQSRYKKPGVTLNEKTVPPETAAAAAANKKKRNKKKKNPSKTHLRNLAKDEARSKGRLTRSSRRPAASSAVPPPPPRTRVTIRNIKPVTTFGSVSQLLQHVVRPLVARANGVLKGTASTSSFRLLALDEASVATHIQQEAAYLEAQQKLEEQAKLEAAAEEKTDSPTELEITPVVPLPNDQAPAATATAPLNVIGVSVMYAVPPKATHRRGEKPGTVYLVLTSPPLEPLTKISVPTTVIETLSDHATMVEDNGKDSFETRKPAATPLSFHHQTNQRKIWLLRAVEALNAAASLLSSTSAPTASHAVASSTAVAGAAAIKFPEGLMVEESLSQKCFWSEVVESPHRKPRDDASEIGTVFDSPDYQEFLASLQRQKEDLVARPRPAPGGTTAGVIDSGSLVGAVLDDKGQPVSAIVLHLQALQRQKELLKQQEQQQKKLRKEQEQRARKKQQQKGGTAATPTAAVAGASKKSRKDKKKKKPDIGATNGRNKKDAPAATESKKGGGGGGQSKKKDTAPKPVLVTPKAESKGGT